jgi:hypothetical protein
MAERISQNGEGGGGNAGEQKNPAPLLTFSPQINYTQ